jgi:hypothetical protein
MLYSSEANRSVFGKGASLPPGKPLARMPAVGQWQIRAPQAEKLLFHFAPPFTGV